MFNETGDPNAGGQSGWMSFHVNAPIDTKAVVSGGDANVNIGQTVDAATLFNVSDPDGHPIVKYQFFDSTQSGDSGHFMVDGVVQGANTALRSDQRPNSLSISQVSMPAACGLALLRRGSVRVPAARPGPAAPTAC